MDLNDSFTENLLQRSKTRKDYLTSKMNETSCTVGRKRTALNDLNVLEDSPKRQCLNPSESDEKENANIRPNKLDDVFVPFKVSTTVRGLAALRKQYNTDSCKDFKTISGEAVLDSEQETVENAISLSEPLDIHKQEGSDHYKYDEITLLKKETTSNDGESHFRFESNKNAEPAALPLAARKAMYEKASAVHNARSSEPAFQPKLTIAQRTAMFENAAKESNQVKPQAKLIVPKRFIPSVSSKTFEVNEQGNSEKDSSQKENSTSGIKFSGHVEKKSSATSEKSTLLSNDKNKLTSNFSEQNSAEDIASSPEKQISDDVFDLPQQTESDLNELAIESTSTQLQQQQFENINSNSPGQYTKLSNTQQQFSETEDNIAQQKTTSNDLLQKSEEDSTPLQNSVSSSSIDSQQQSKEKSSADSLQGEVVPEKVSRNVIPSLVNHWEKLSSSSSFGNSNSEEEPSTRQSGLNAYESEGEHADCESNLESEYTAAESMSEYNEGESISESIKDSSVTDLEDEAMETEVFNPVKFSSEAGLSYFDVETDSFPATDDETTSHNGRNWQENVNDSNYSTDDISLKSAISETSLGNESTVNHKIQCPTNSSSESIGPNQDNESAGKKEVSVGTSISRVGSPLIHTVSIYRKHRLASKSSPIVATKRSHSQSENDNSTHKIQQQIKLLQEEIVRQQTVIGQTSRALNLCHSTAEFSGSSEQIEAERLLLIATEKRQACLNEIHCLKSQDSKGECITDGNGTLIITDLKLPLKRDFITLQLKGETGSVHCFLCLIRHGPQVIVTKMVSTGDNITDGALCFSNHVKLHNLPPDFSIVFEVYALKTSKENLSHDKKYHIKREHSKLRLNSKYKKTESKLLLPAISSPGGPNNARSPSFALLGCTRFTVQNCSKKCFSLDKIPYTSPLEGILKVNLHLHAEHDTTEKGFLTRFEDVGGYGLWNRLWCSLESHQLSYWKYPDEEEQRKEPMGTIDLKQCVTGQARAVSRDVCARPNTFLLMTVRKKEDGDRNTLVSESVDGLTTTRHMLSADTKEERIVWCNKLNEALINVRKWDARALRPADQK